MKKIKLLVVWLVTLLSALFVVGCSKQDDGYTVTVDTFTGGSVYASAETVAAGQDVTFTIRCDDGYEVDYLKVNDQAVVLAQGQTTFEVVSVQCNISVTGAFKPIELTIVKNQTVNGSVSIASNAQVGQTVTLGVTPNQGYVLDKVIIGKESGGAVEYDYATNSFVMPGCNVSVIVTFTEKRLTAPAVSFDPIAHQLSWSPVENAVGYVVSTDGGVTWSATQTATIYEITTIGSVEVMVKAVADGVNEFDSVPVVCVADNRYPLATPIVTVTDNLADAFEISWENVEHAEGYRYMFVVDGEELESYMSLDANTTSVSFPYLFKPVSVKIKVYAVGNDLYKDSEIAADAFAITAPTFSRGAEKDVFVAPEGKDTVEYTLTTALPGENTQIRTKISKVYINFYAGAQVAGTVDTAYNANGFFNGIYAGSVTDGMTINLEKNFGYKVEYTAYNHFGLEEKQTQFIAVIDNEDKIDLNAEEYYPELFSAAQFYGVPHLSVIEHTEYPLLGEGKIFRLFNGTGDKWANGTFSNPVYLADGAKLSFWGYNNSECDLLFTFSSSAPTLIRAKSYFFWNVAYVDGSVQANYKTTENKLGKIYPQYYNGVPVIEFDARKEDWQTAAIGVYDIYIGHFQFEKEIFELAAPDVKVNENVLSWAAVKNATGYEISWDHGENWTSVTELTYTIAQTDVVLEVWVRSTGDKPFQPSVSCAVTVDLRENTAQPGNLSIIKNTDNYTAIWMETSAVDGYRYRLVNADGNVIKDWTSLVETSVSLTAQDYGKLAGTVKIQVVAFADGKADSVAVAAEFTLVAPTFNSAPKDRYLPVLYPVFYINAAATAQPYYEAPLTSNDGTVTWRLSKKTLHMYHFIAGATGAGVLNPQSSNDGFVNGYYQHSDGTSTFSGSYGYGIAFITNNVYTIEYTATSAYGIEAYYNQRILVDGQNANKKNLLEKYSDLFTANSIATAGDTRATVEENVGVMEMFGGTAIHITGGNAQVYANATMMFDQKKFDMTGVTEFGFFIYNNSDKAIQFADNGGKYFSVAAKSYGYFNYSDKVATGSDAYYLANWVHTDTGSGKTMLGKLLPQFYGDTPTIQFDVRDDQTSNNNYDFYISSFFVNADFVTA